MILHKRSFITTVLVVSAAVAGDNSADIYIVKPGDVLSRIARKIGTPIYTPNGSLHRLLQLNPQIQDKHRIFVGQKVYLGPQVMVAHACGVDEAERDIASEQPAVVPPPTAPPPPQALPVETPSPSVVSGENPNEEVQHSLGFFGGYALTTLHASDASTSSTANLYSTNDVTAGIMWSQGWSPTLGTFAFASVRHIDIAPSTNALKTLTHTSQTMTDLGFGVQHWIGRKFKLKYSFSDGSELYLHGMSTSSLSVDSVQVMRLMAQGSYLLLEKGKTSLSAFGSVGYIFGTTADSYTIDDGTLFGAGFSLRYGGRNRTLLLDAGLADRRQSTSVASINETSFFTRLTMWIPFFFEGPSRHSAGE